MEKPPLQLRASPSQRENRQRLLDLFEKTPLPLDELLVNLPLYMRSSVVAKLLWVNELYEQIVQKPGVILEFGTWWGANLALFESLRAVHEPYNYTRRIVGFDTFSGYTAPVGEDEGSDLVREGSYSLPDGYPDYLRELLSFHEAENPMSHLGKHEVIEGDVSTTCPRYLASHPETIVALAYFDLQLYDPTRACLEAIGPYLARGSVIAMDELNAVEFPGETVAFREAIGLGRYELRRSRFLPDRTYFVVD